MTIPSQTTLNQDAESALQVMEFLKNYVRAAAGRRVILTIHQPSSFVWTLIDHVVLLSQGRLMFQGPRNEIEDFFTQQGCPTQAGWNPSDHYVTAVNDEFRNHELSVEEWAKRYVEWTEMPQHAKVVHTPKKRSPSRIEAFNLELVETQRRGSGGGVVVELIYRYFLNLWFNPGILGTRVAMYSLFALMVGALFLKLGGRDDF